MPSNPSYVYNYAGIINSSLNRDQKWKVYKQVMNQIVGKQVKDTAQGLLGMEINSKAFDILILTAIN